jgi:hypothetical protein
VNPTVAPWATETNVARARELWAAGASTTDIGRAVGTTSDAIVGYAHRHGWGPHPRQPTGGRKRGTPNPRPRREAAEPAAPPEPAPKSPAARAAPVPVPAHRRCQWIEATHPLRMCGCPTAQHSSWCSDHQARVWVRPPRRLEVGL